MVTGYVGCHEKYQDAVDRGFYGAVMFGVTSVQKYGLVVVIDLVRQVSGITFSNESPFVVVHRG